VRVLWGSQNRCGKFPRRLRRKATFPQCLGRTDFPDYSPGVILDWSALEVVDREFLRICIRNSSDFKGFQARNSWCLRERQQGCLRDGKSKRASTTGRSLLSSTTNYPRLTENSNAKCYWDVVDSISRRLGLDHTMLASQCSRSRIRRLTCSGEMEGGFSP
jgi:hypothetical protein